MTLFILNILLALMWVLLWGLLDVYSIVVGLVGGYFVLWAFTRTVRPGLLADAYGNRVVDLARFAAHFVVLLLKSNLQLAREIVTPGYGMTPRLLRYDVAGLSDAQIVALSNAITLTPGTLVVDISPDKSHLYVHCMYAADERAARADLDALRRRMEREVFRTTAAGATL